MFGLKLVLFRTKVRTTLEAKCLRKKSCFIPYENKIGSFTFDFVETPARACQKHKADHTGTCCCQDYKMKIFSFDFYTVRVAIVIITTNIFASFSVEKTAIFTSCLRAHADRIPILYVLSSDNNSFVVVRAWRTAITPESKNLQRFLSSNTSIMGVRRRFKDFFSIFMAFK